MKITLSKNQWKQIGKTAGWVKKSQSEWDIITIGPTPSDEPCAQVGSDNYPDLNPIEISVYAKQILRSFPNIPESVKLKRHGQSHDFGTYHELAIQYKTNDEIAVDWAFSTENNLPSKWDQQSIVELEKYNYFQRLQSKT